MASREDFVVLHGFSESATIVEAILEQVILDTLSVSHLSDWPLLVLFLIVVTILNYNGFLINFIIVITK